MHDEVQRVRDLRTHRGVRQAEPGHQRERLHAAQGLRRRAGVDGRERAVMAGRERGEHVVRLGPADLADDDPVRAHPQRVSHQRADRHLAAPFDVRRPRLEPHDVRERQSQLGRVLDRDDALALADRAAERAERRRLAAARPAADEHVQATADRALQQLAQRGRPGAELDELAAGQAARAKAADRERRPVDGQRRQHDVHACAVWQTRVADRLGLVRAPPGSREQPLDRLAQLASVENAQLRELRAGRRARPTPAPCRIPGSRRRSGSLSRPSIGPSPSACSAIRAATAARVGASSTPASRATAAAISRRLVERPNRRLAVLADGSFGRQRLLEQLRAQRARELVDVVGVGGGLHARPSKRGAGVSPGASIILVGCCSARVALRLGLSRR